MSIFTGSATAVITPFKNGEIDFDSFGRIIDFQLAGGIDAIVVCGTTGEAPTLSFDEKCELFKYAVERVAGKVPVIAGTGSNNTHDAVLLSQAAEQAGASGLLVVAPFYNKSTQAGIIAHYTAIADSVNIPVIIYNIPSRTGVNILPETIKKLCTHKNIAGVKEASGNISQITKLAAICPECDIYSGNDDQVLPILSLGGKGVISTISNLLPKEMHELCSAYFAGNTDRARKLQFRLLPIFSAAFCEVNPIPIKAMMHLYGMCENEIRLPLIQPSDASMEKITNAMKEYGLL